MDGIKLYEINPNYVDYLAPYAEHLFRNKKPNQQNERKYIGVILTVNGKEYFAPLSSFKPKHASIVVTKGRIGNAKVVIANRPERKREEYYADAVKKAFKSLE